mmetsp:Transcript_2375/g.5274  ORF Transcript_2375/g.5274 Transcript_2375/m.5274 type:complete len:214 (-) Transcript_2375:149-790(-)
MIPTPPDRASHRAWVTSCWTFHCGGRLARNAPIPSVDTEDSRSRHIPPSAALYASAPMGTRSWARMPALPLISNSRGANAMRRAIRRAASAAVEPSGATSLTSPLLYASATEMGVPVNSIFEATFFGTARSSGTEGVWQNSPIFTPGTQKLAVASATTTSQEQASWHPAAWAAPCTAATTGIGSSLAVSITEEQRANSPSSRALSQELTSFRS